LSLPPHGAVQWQIARLLILLKGARLAGGDVADSANGSLTIARGDQRRDVNQQANDAINASAK